MRYLVIVPFAVKTKKAGTVNLSQGQIVELAEDKARSFLTEGKIKKVIYSYNNVIKRITGLFNGEVVGFTGLLQEIFEERSAIVEFDGGLLREQAESIAIRTILDTLNTHNQETIF